MKLELKCPQCESRQVYTLKAMIRVCRKCGHREKLEAVLNPRGKRRRSDEEEEKYFFEVIQRFKSLLGMREEHISFFLKLFEIEKEQARKEKRHLEPCWNVFFLASDERIRLMCGCPPLSQEHEEKVEQYFSEIGHPRAETM